METLEKQADEIAQLNQQVGYVLPMQLPKPNAILA
jgi:hypothetical protein